MLAPAARDLLVMAKPAVISMNASRALMSAALMPCAPILQAPTFALARLVSREMEEPVTMSMSARPTPVCAMSTKFARIHWDLTNVPVKRVIFGMGRCAMILTNA